MIETDLTLTNKLGLHARAAAVVTRTAAEYKSSITLHGNGRTADAKSIITVMTMGVKSGDKLTIRADGPDEKESVEALKKLIENKFYEEQ